MANNSYLNLKSSDFLRRRSSHPGWLAAGGGDSGWAPQAQPCYLTTFIMPENPAPFAHLPKGTILLGTAVIPDGINPATAGTVTLTDSNAVVRIAAAPANVPAFTTLAAPIYLPADTGYSFTSVGIIGVVAVGLYVILPRMRP